MDLIKDVKIKIKKINRGNLLANATVEFGDMVTIGYNITGFKVLAGKYDDTGLYDKDGNPIWVAPPSYSDNVGTFKNIFFASPPVWKELQNMIIVKFLEEID